MPEENNQLQVIEKSIEQFKAGPAILKKNQTRAEAARRIGKEILDEWQRAEQIEDETERLEAMRKIDQRSNNYLVKAGTAYEEMKEERSALTQLMTNYAKMFTGAEAEVDKTKPASMPFQVQQYRNELAELEAKEKAKIAKAAADKLRKETAKIEFKASVLTVITNSLNDYLAKRKLAVTDAFNATTLETFANVSSKLKAMVITFPKEKQGDIIKVDWAAPDMLTADDVEEIKAEVTLEFEFDDFYKTYETEVAALKQDLVDKLGSKKAELVEAKRLADEAEKERLDTIEKNRIAEEQRQKDIAAAAGKKKKELEEADRQAKIDEAFRLKDLQIKADEAEKQRAEIIKERELQDKIKLDQEAAQKKEESESKIQLGVEGAKAMSLFDQMAATTVMVSVPQAKEAVLIEVQHPAGYVEIFTHWFNSVGKTLGIDELSKKTLLQMKAFAEADCLKNGVEIKSKMLVYKTRYKAKNIK